MSENVLEDVGLSKVWGTEEEYCLKFKGGASLPELAPALASVPTVSLLWVDGGGKKEVSDQDMVSLVEACEEGKVCLKDVSLGMCPQLTDATLVALAPVCAENGPATLNVERNKNMTDAGIRAIVGASLTELNLSSVDNVTDDLLLHIAQSCPALKNLYLDRIPNVSDVGVIALAKSCPLSFVSLERTNVTDASIAAIATSSPDLDSLYIDFCDALTDLSHAYVKSLKAFFPSARQEAAEALAASVPDLVTDADPDAVDP